MLPLLALTNRKVGPAAVSAGHEARELFTGSGFTLHQALRTPRSWAMGPGMILVAGAPSAAVFHPHSCLKHKGLNDGGATTALSLMGPALLVGRIATDWLLDVTSARVVSLCIFPFSIITCIILAIFGGSLTLANMAAVCMGLALGAEGDMLAYFVSRHFGVRNYDSIYAALIGLFSIGAGGFPRLLGFISDYRGSYDQAFAISAALTAIGALILALLATTLGSSVDAP